MPTQLDRVDNHCADRDRFRHLAETRSQEVRDQLISSHMGLAIHIAKRYRRPHVDTDDLRQIALVGLTKAVDRFDPDHGACFSTFAGRTIEGELRRYFRDLSWSVRVPRSAKELRGRMRQAVDELVQIDGCAPTTARIARHLGVAEDEVVGAELADAAYAVASLDDDRSCAPSVERHEGRDDVDEIKRSIDRRLVATALDGLEDRERTIVFLRYYLEWPQREIADAVGVSQMHVSRLLQQSLGRLRRELHA